MTIEEMFKILKAEDLPMVEDASLWSPVRRTEECPPLAAFHRAWKSGWSKHDRVHVTNCEYCQDMVAAMFADVGCPSFAQLVAYLMGWSKDSRAIETHLKECSHCKERLAPLALVKPLENVAGSFRNLLPLPENLLRPLLEGHGAPPGAVDAPLPLYSAIYEDLDSGTIQAFDYRMDFEPEVAGTRLVFGVTLLPEGLRLPWPLRVAIIPRGSDQPIQGGLLDRETGGVAIDLPAELLSEAPWMKTHGEPEGKGNELWFVLSLSPEREEP